MGTDGGIGYRVTPLGAGEVGSRTLRVWKAKPDYTDISVDGIVYLGYYNGTDYDICKVDYSGDVLTREWATGNWTDRANLFVPLNAIKTVDGLDYVKTLDGDYIVTI